MRKDVIEGEIIDFTHEGNGVIRLDNFVVFTDGGVIGDKVRVKITKFKKRFGEGIIIKTLEESKDRVRYDFEIEDSASAVPLIDYDYEKQLEWKEEKVRSDLERIGKLENININKIIGMENPFNYRNHVQIPVGSKNGKNIYGFYRGKTNSIVGMDKSILLSEKGNQVFEKVRNFLDRENIKGYNRRRKEGLVKHIGIRTNDKDEIMLILVVRERLSGEVKEKLEEELKSDVVSIFENINRGDKFTYGKEYYHIYGDIQLEYELDEKTYRVSPNSFFQVNTSQVENMYNKVREYLEGTSEDVVYDLYSGIGTISLYLADDVKKVYGIEIVKQAVEDARQNANLNRVENAEFLRGSSEEIFNKLEEQDIVGNKLILDPPRAGCDEEVLESIIKLNPEKIVYVSCNPSTLARDLKVLVENGYEVLEVQPVDMFPHTAHVESIALLQREIL